MPRSVALRIPAIGEGLQEAMLVNKLKKPGDAIKRDEPIYEMETDKAVMAVESPCDGVIEDWLADEGSVLAVGAEVVRVATEDAVEGAVEAPTVATVEAAAVMAGAPPTAAPHESVSAGNLAIPPRTRAYAKNKGIGEADLGRIPTKGGKMMPEDIDAFLAAAAPSSNGAYRDEPLPIPQKTLNFRMARGAQLVIPGSIERPVNWTGIETVRQAFKDKGGEFQPSQYTIFAYCVAQVAKKHPRFRASLPDDSTLRTYNHMNLGTAVALPGDVLLTAVTEAADSLDFRAFCDRTRQAIELARTGKDQATEATQLTITNMSNFGLRSAVPVLVSPAAAVLFMGETYDLPVPFERGFRFQRTVNLVLTFDHRVNNGVGAANFLLDICQAAEGVEELLAGQY